MNKVPTERMESTWFCQWCTYNDLPVAHFANEGRRSLREGHGLKMMGLQKGFPDFVIARPMWPYGALFIEMKRVGATERDLTPHQVYWLNRLNQEGNYAIWTPGWIKAKEVVEWYLKRASN